MSDNLFCQSVFSIIYLGAKMERLFSKYMIVMCCAAMLFTNVLSAAAEGENRLNLLNKIADLGIKFKKAERDKKKLRLAVKILQIDQNASKDEIAKVFKQQSIILHPDRNQEQKESATQAFIALKRAYEFMRWFKGLNAAAQLKLSAKKAPGDKRTVYARAMRDCDHPLHEERKRAAGWWAEFIDGDDESDDSEYEYSYDDDSHYTCEYPGCYFTAPTILHFKGHAHTDKVSYSRYYPEPGDEGSEAQKPDVFYTCTDCGFKTIGRTDLMLHMRRIHNK